MQQISGFQFRNGGFGLNHGHLTRVAGGYTVGFGTGGDSFFIRRPTEAKRAYRQALAMHRDAPEFRAYPRNRSAGAN